MLFEKNWEREARVYLFAIPKMQNLCGVCVRGLTAKLAKIPSYILQIECFKEETFLYLLDTLAPCYDTLQTYDYKYKLVQLISYSYLANQLQLQ